MKKFISLSTFCIVAGILLTSCGTRLSMTKRHYNQGYYVAHSNTKHSSTAQADKKVAIAKTNPSVHTMPAMTDESTLNGYTYTKPSTINAPVTASAKKMRSARAPYKNAQQFSGKKMALKSHASLQKKNNAFEVKKMLGGSEREGLSLFWLIILIIVILWAVGFLAGGFGLGGLINLLLLIALILFILWLLRIV